MARVRLWVLIRTGQFCPDYIDVMQEEDQQDWLIVAVHQIKNTPRA